MCDSVSGSKMAAFLSSIPNDSTASESPSLMWTVALGTLDCSAGSHNEAKSVRVRDCVQFIRYERQIPKNVKRSSTIHDVLPVSS